MASKKMLLGDKSVRHLLQENLQTNLHKIVSNLQKFTLTQEPETLHQYRVAIRVTRCVCREFREFMEEKRQILLNKKLKVLQRETNAMRDIDVFLESLQAYEKEVSPECKKVLEMLKRKLCDEKEVLWLAFNAKYTSSEQEKVKIWFEQLKNDEKLCVSKSNEKFFKYSLEILQKRLRKISKISRKLTLETPNDMFHSLRLHYKKMRYTSDALGLDTFSKSFKPIQNAFGAVQDKNTQIERLKGHQNSLGICFQEVITLLEEGVRVDKQVCIEKSTVEEIKILQEKIEKIFTCKVS